MLIRLHVLFASSKPLSTDGMVARGTKSQVVHLISADGPRHHTLPVCVDYHQIVHCSTDCCIVKETDIRIASASFLDSPHHNVSTHRARFRGRQLVARLGPYRYRVPPLERKQHHDKWNGFTNRPEHHTRVAWDQLCEREWNIWFSIWNAVDVSMYVERYPSRTGWQLTAQQAAVCQHRKTEQIGP